MVGDKILGADGLANVASSYVYDVQQYIEDNHRHTTPDQLTRYNFFRMWLEWNGIRGYTMQILAVLDQLGMLKEGV